MLERFAVTNFKSLKSVDLELPPFSVFVGANAAGKTNLVDSLDFLGKCFRDGLATAVQAKGGYENVSFRRARRAKSALRFSLVYRLRRPSRFSNLSLNYEFSFRAIQQAIGAGYEVETEVARFDWNEGGHGHYLTLDRAKRTVVSSHGDRLPGMPPLKFLVESLREGANKDELLLPTRFSHWGPFRDVVEAIASVRIYQISPTQAREPGDPSGRKELGQMGANLPAALRFLHETNPDGLGELVSHLTAAAPTFESVETDYIETKELGLFVKEKGVGRRWYAADLSDGTLKTLAVFVPLLDPRFEVVAIEEPENGIHPWVIRDLVETCRQRSSTKQILLTTHSPVLVSHLRPEELFLVDRQQGETHILPARAVSHDLDSIIQGGFMDLGQYWNSGQLSAVPDGLPLWDLASESEAPSA